MTTPNSAAFAPTPAVPLLERLRLAAIAQGTSVPTADTHVSWVRTFILFHNKRHPNEMDLPEVTHFLEHVVKTSKEPLLALAQARAALTVLYRAIVGRDLGELPQPRPAGVTSPLDVLPHVTTEAIEEAVAANRRLGAGTREQLGDRTKA